MIKFLSVETFSPAGSDVESVKQFFQVITTLYHEWFIIDYDPEVKALFNKDESL